MYFLFKKIKRHMAFTREKTVIQIRSVIESKLPGIMLIDTDVSVM